VSFGSLRAGAHKSELIVVASLIDKAPNLGGLARTCEIFDAQCLVVDDKDICTHREFTLLSMSAEKWLDIKEVPAADLPRWLGVRTPPLFWTLVVLLASLQKFCRGLLLVVFALRALVATINKGVVIANAQLPR
jgi:hypothetical protein